MPNKTFKDMGFKMDNSGGTLTDIFAYLNAQDIERSIDLIEDTGMADTQRSYLTGLAGTKLTISGMVNTTTDGILGPLVNAQQTSVTKTIEYKAYASRYYNGEAFVTNVKYSGSINNLETFSASVTFDGAVNRTSVGLS